tara:strand:+ start:8326 stop:9750 length:1425 start_codon:yes stop_codon:yes gene_type:complete
MSKITIIIIINLCIFTDAYCNNNNEIAKNLCSSCHLFPNPEIMYKEDWEYGAFPYLEHILGLNNLQNYSSEQKNEITDKWDKIKKFYLKNSTNYSNNKTKRKTQYNNFNVLNKIDNIESSAIFYDYKNRNILIGDVGKKSIKIFDLNGIYYKEVKIGKIPTHINRYNDKIFVCSNNSLNPIDSELCELGYINEKYDYQVKYSNLNRPTYYNVVYINSNKYELLLEYGNKMGKAQLRKNNIIIWHKNISGAIDAEIVKDNNRLDIFILFAQEHEMLLHLNVSSMIKEKIILKKHPGWGFTGIEINKDKFKSDSIIYLANGDTTEFQSYPRKYHGLRKYVFNDNLVELKFIPVHGVLDFKIVNNHFRNHDDLISVSYFADFKNHPEQSVMIHKFNDNGDYNSLEIPFQMARWARIALIKNKLDNDYKIVLGSMNFKINNRVYENNISYLNNFKIPREITDAWAVNGNQILFLQHEK